MAEKVTADVHGGAERQRQTFKLRNFLANLLMKRMINDHCPFLYSVLGYS